MFEWRKSVHYGWSYILFSPECKELTSMLDPLLYRWGVPPVVIRCVHWTMQMWVLQTWIKAQGLAIVMKFGHRITETLDSIDYEIHNSIQITFHLAHKWSKCVVSEFSEIMLHKWYFCKLHMIRRKRDNGISIADEAEILITLSCSKTSICKYCYQASHPDNSDVENEYHSYHRSLNTVDMGQNKQDLQCLCSEGVTVLHLATDIFQETHAPLSCNSSWDIVLTIICPSLKERQFYLYSWSILNATAFF